MTFDMLYSTGSTFRLRLPDQAERFSSEFAQSLAIGRPPSPTGETGGRSREIAEVFPKFPQQPNF